MERGRSATLAEVPPASQVLPPLVQVVQVVWISGAREAQRQVANQRRWIAACTSAARAWLSWAEATPLLANAEASKGVLLTIKVWAAPALRGGLSLRLRGGGDDDGEGASGSTVRAGGARLPSSRL